MPEIRATAANGGASQDMQDFLRQCRSDVMEWQEETNEVDDGTIGKME